MVRSLYHVSLVREYMSRELRPFIENSNPVRCFSQRELSQFGRVARQGLDRRHSWPRVTFGLNCINDQAPRHKIHHHVMNDEVKQKGIALVQNHRAPHWPNFNVGRAPSRVTCSFEVFSVFGDGVLKRRFTVNRKLPPFLPEESCSQHGVTTLNVQEDRVNNLRHFGLSPHFPCCFELVDKVWMIDTMRPL